MGPLFRPEGLVLGVALIGLGAIWTFANLGWLDLVPALRVFWPLLLVLWGGLELARSLAARRAR